MTISKPRQGEYNANYDPRPKTVTIGVSLITVEEHTFIQDGRTVTCPVDDDIHYLTVDKKLIEVPNQSCIKYDVIADLLEKDHGYLKKHWQIMSVWECVPQHIADEIF